MAASRNSPPNNLADRVAALVASRIGDDERLCVGLSGGCDSVVLLHVLAGLGLGERIQVAHVHHGLSPHADRWAAFCADYCRDLGVPFALERVTVDRSSGLGLEAAARVARYEAFSRCAGNVLLLGHHQGDQAETLLFNLLRGAGVAGAAAIPRERRHQHLRILRPMLAVARQEIEAYARAHGLAWIDDESNSDTGLTRNFLRHAVLPLLASRFPAAEQRLAQAAGHFAEADALLGELACIDWQAVAEGDSLRLARLRELSLPRIKNLLRYHLRQLGWHAPATARLEEFSRQLQAAGADRHPALDLAEGSMVAGRGLLRWVARR
jgi:tRNA(Ile)-lysidine synthase